MFKGKVSAHWTTRGCDDCSSALSTSADGSNTGFRRQRSRVAVMVVVMQEGASEEQIQRVIGRLVARNFDVHRSTGATHTVLGVVGTGEKDPRELELLEGVHEVVKVSNSYKLASRAFKPDGTVVKVGVRDNTV